MGKSRVLIMDDEPMLREALQMILSALGYESDAVRDGAEAVAVYQNARAAGKAFDVVILDLTIPSGMGGLDTFQRLRELDPGVRALVSSGYSMDDELADYAKHGFAGVLAKPYQVEELSQVLARVMEGRE